MTETSHTTLSERPVCYRYTGSVEGQRRFGNCYIFTLVVSNRDSPDKRVERLEIIAHGLQHPITHGEKIMVEVSDSELNNPTGFIPDYPSQKYISPKNIQRY